MVPVALVLIRVVCHCVAKINIMIEVSPGIQEEDAHVSRG